LRRESEIAFAQTAIAATLWGTSFPVVTWGIQGGLDPRAFIFLRFAASVPFMLLMAKALGRHLVPLFKSRAIWIVGAFNAVGFLCQFIGQQYTGAYVAALLTNVSVVFAAVGSVVFLGERIGRYKLAGVTLAMVGTALITTNGDFDAIAGGQTLGDILYLLAAASWAGYILYSKKKMDEQEWDPLAAATCIVAVTAILVAPAALSTGALPSLSRESVIAILYTAGFNTVIPFVLYQQGLKRLSASSSAVVLLLEIIVALLISVAFLGEMLTTYSWAGALAVLGSILLVSGLEVRGKSLSVELRKAAE